MKVQSVVINSEVANKQTNKLQLRHNLIGCRLTADIFHVFSKLWIIILYSSLCVITLNGWLARYVLCTLWQCGPVCSYWRGMNQGSRMAMWWVFGIACMSLVWLICWLCSSDESPTAEADEVPLIMNESIQATGFDTDENEYLMRSRSARRLHRKSIMYYLCDAWIEACSRSVDISYFGCRIISCCLNM